MGRNPIILVRRDFIRAGILGCIAFSLRSDGLFSSILSRSGSDEGHKSNGQKEAQSRVYDLINKYGAEFGAIKPHMRRQRNGSL
jgi:hypothetical protein